MRGVTNKKIQRDADLRWEGEDEVAVGVLLHSRNGCLDKLYAAGKENGDKKKTNVIHGLTTIKERDESERREIDDR